jgi:hypothetical protein
MSRKIHLRISSLRNNLEILKKMDSLRLNPIFSTLLCHMFGGLIPLCFGERKELLKYGTNQWLPFLVSFGLQRTLCNGKFQNS